MINFNIILLSFKAHLKQIGLYYSYPLVICIILTIILYLFNDYHFDWRIYDAHLCLIFFKYELYVNILFITSVLGASIISLTDEVNHCFVMLVKKNNYTREILIGKLLSVYLFIITFVFIFTTRSINSFCYASLKFPMILPALLIVIFFHCTVIVLTTSLKNKTYFWFYIIILTIYAVYSSIPLLDDVPSKSLIHYIIFGEFSELEISYWIKEMYLPLHIIMSILLIYSVPYFIKNIESCE